MRALIPVVLLLLVSACTYKQTVEDAAGKEAQKLTSCPNYVRLPDSGRGEVVLDGCGVRYSFFCERLTDSQTGMVFYHCRHTKTFTYPELGEGAR